MGVTIVSGNRAEIALRPHGSRRWLTFIQFDCKRALDLGAVGLAEAKRALVRLGGELGRVEQFGRNHEIRRAGHQNYSCEPPNTGAPGLGEHMGRRTRPSITCQVNHASWPNGVKRIGKVCPG
ncbi:hypothetical protein GCM10010836_56170 [Aminobacter aminovorans]